MSYIVVGGPLQKNREHQKNRWLSVLRRRFNRSLCVQLVAVGDSDTVSRLASLHRCMLRRGIGSTGAEEAHSSTQTSVLEHNISNAPVLDSKASVQPVLKGELRSTKTYSLEQNTSIAPVLIFLTIGSTGAIEFLTCFLPSSREDRPAGHRSFRQASDAPMLGHRFNRCCCFSLFSAELTWIRM